LALVLATRTHAQAPITFQYFYDELGQLVKVVDSTGTVIEYIYDEVGNILEIKRTSAAGLAIFNFTPSRGPIGTAVTIQGQGFSANPIDNIVRFNGTSAEVTSATPTTLVAVVPVGAMTGKISVEVGAATAESSQNFTVTNAPVITSVHPSAAFSGSIITSFQVTGMNLSGAAFSFLPEFILPAGIAINSTTVDSSGTLATLNLTVGANARGSFVLVATNADGNSGTAPSAGNTLTISDLDPTTAEEDTDGDGFPNGLEILLGSDPLDPNSIPDPTSHITEVISTTFSLLNTGAPSPSLPNEAVSPIFSLLNTGVASSELPNEAVGPTFSILNTENPDPPDLPGEVVGPTFSIQNQASP
jgi:YD repeat-containing protein